MKSDSNIQYMLVQFLSIVIPCLNESETIGAYQQCKKAFGGIFTQR
jgi:hypothetical protein